MEYIIYCDESIKQGKYYSNFYGGTLVSSEWLTEVRSALQSKKEGLGLQEIKWAKTSAAYLDKYIEMMALFFDFIAAGKIKVRIMFTHNIYQPKNLTREQLQESYFKLYYQFLKHAFGLRYSNPGRDPIYLRLYFDKFPDTKEKADKFKEFVYGLQHLKEFREAHLLIRREDIAEVDSKDHVILQCTDIVLGSMQFRLNDLHKEKPKGQRRRAAKTIAKEKLYKYINKRIRQIHPGFNIGVSTGTPNGVTDRWHHPYRHWEFIPENHEVDHTKSKHKQEGPIAPT
ncbi:MAG TPA: DUF3800 domain-containing protein [Firmicutes bacterium]|uniref:DUF3800 domain-containing protein n=1 Tax=Gelria sp. Kuro-4 TaxID=2796927 RepID=UPI0019AB9702|nr:DUF3800 domain-containing protein [Gelria sp. Kuro-4]BCV23476.1 hypothetical protein kuro4_02490 [Gelria sp. Kuro-4]HHV58616.1 DUF3800 domain-containing protein [Bacillota bacterium]